MKHIALNSYFRRPLYVTAIGPIGTRAAAAAAEVQFLAGGAGDTAPLMDKLFAAVPVSPTFAATLEPSRSVLDRDRDGSEAASTADRETDARRRNPMSPAKAAHASSTSTATTGDTATAPSAAETATADASASLAAAPATMAADASAASGASAAPAAAAAAMSVSASASASSAPTAAAASALPPPPHMVEAGDYLVTRHSNLRDVQLLFHLMGTKPPKRAKVGKSELVKTHAQALEGLRQVRGSPEK